MYYIENGGVYRKEAKGFRAVSITVKEDRNGNIKAITVTPGKETIKEVKSLQNYTLDEIVRKFGVTEDNPIKAE
jgi:hypothetical protein